MSLKVPLYAIEEYSLFLYEEESSYMMKFHLEYNNSLYIPI